MGSRLVMSPLDGSSRIARLHRIYSSRSVNQPFFRNHRFVRVGAGAIWKNDLICLVPISDRARAGRALPNSNRQHEDTFDEKEPSPSFSTGHATHTQYTERDQRRNDVAVGVSLWSWHARATGKILTQVVE